MLFRAVCLKQTTVLIGQSEGLPNITGSIETNRNMVPSSGSTTSTGALSFTEWNNGNAFGSGHGSEKESCRISFSATNSNTIYGASNHVTPNNATIKVWQRIS